MSGGGRPEAVDPPGDHARRTRVPADVETERAFGREPVEDHGTVAGHALRPWAAGPNAIPAVPSPAQTTASSYATPSDSPGWVCTPSGTRSVPDATVEAPVPVAAARAARARAVSPFSADAPELRCGADAGIRRSDPEPGSGVHAVRQRTDSIVTALQTDDAVHAGDARNKARSPGGRGRDLARKASGAAAPSRAPAARPSRRRTTVPTSLPILTLAPCALSRVPPPTPTSPDRTSSRRGPQARTPVSERNLSNTHGGRARRRRRSPCRRPRSARPRGSARSRAVRRSVTRSRAAARQWGARGEDSPRRTLSSKRQLSGLPVHGGRFGAGEHGAGFVPERRGHDAWAPAARRHPDASGRCRRRRWVRSPGR